MKKIIIVVDSKPLVKISVNRLTTLKDLLDSSNKFLKKNRIQPNKYNVILRLSREKDVPSNILTDPTYLNISPYSQIVDGESYLFYILNRQYMTVSQLKNICKQLGIKGYSNKNKAWLLENCRKTEQKIVEKEIIKQEPNWLNITPGQAQLKYEELYKEIPKVVKDFNIWNEVLQIRKDKDLSPEEILDKIPIYNEVMRQKLLKQYPDKESMYKYYVDTKEDQYYAKMVYPNLSDKQVRENINSLKLKLDDLHFWINAYIDIINEWKRSKGYKEIAQYKKYWIKPKVKFEINGKFFKNIINTISSVYKDVNFTFYSKDEPGLYVQIIDPSNVALLILYIPEIDFDSYNADDNMVIGVDLSKIKKFLKNVKSKDKIEFIGDEDSIKIKNLNTDKQINIETLIIDEEYLSIPETQYSVMLRMETKKLYEILRDLRKKKDKLDPYLKIKTTPDSISFDDYTLYYKDFKPGDFAADPLEMDFFIRPLLKFVTSARNLSKNIDLSMSDNTPLKISFNIPDLGYLQYHLAPQE